MNRNQRWYHRNLEQERQRGRDKYNRLVGTAEGSSRNLLRGAKQRASKKSLPFDLDHDWVSSRVGSGHCEVTGIEFSVTGGRDPFGPTIDREVPALGYIKDNCRVVVWAYNAAKGCGTHDDVLKLAVALHG